MRTRRIPRSVIALGLAAAVGGPFAIGSAAAAPTGAAPSPGGDGTGAATSPAAPEPAAPAAPPVYYDPTPAPAASPAPAPVTQAVPQVSQAAQPLEPETEYVYLPSEKEYITVTEYVDRYTVEESGGLLVMNPEVQRQVGPVQAYNAAEKNYNQRSNYDKGRLNLAAGSAATGAAVGGTLGAAGGAAAGFVGGAAAGAGVTAPFAIVFTGLGPIGATAVPAGMAIGSVLGAGAGAVAGAGAGAAGGANVALDLTGTKEDVQLYAADTVWDLENTARKDNGYKGLVGDKPSGLEGYRYLDEGDDTRVTEGTVLGEGTDVNDNAPVTGEDIAEGVADGAADAVQEATETLPSPYQEVSDWSENTQQQVNDFGAGVGNAAADAATGAAEQAPEPVSTAVNDTTQQVNDATTAIGDSVNDAVDGAQQQFHDAVADNQDALPSLPF